MQNPISAITDNPNNPFERTKQAVSNTFGDLIATDTGQEVVKKLEPAVGIMEKIGWAYREAVSPALTAVLLELNSNYRAQNKDLSVIDQMRRGFELSKKPVDEESEWRRAISPGRALVGLIGNINPFGKDGVDSIDWANSKQVNDFFSSGSAQFWSGFADLGFNILDPATYVGGKALKIVKQGLITREVDTIFATPEKLGREIDEVIQNPESKAAANAIFKLVEKDPDNLRAIQGYGLVANSNNPMRLAVALSDAYKAGGRSTMGDILKASIGDVNAINRIKSEHSDTYVMIQENAGLTASLEKELENFSKVKDSPTDYTPEEVTASLAAKEKVVNAINAANAKQAELSAKAKRLDPLVEEDISANQTWSRFGLMERIRTGLAEANSKGFFLEVDPLSRSSLAKAVSKDSNIPTIAARTVMWINPNQQLKEVPSGAAHLGGAAGDRSYLEADARINRTGKLTSMTEEEMNNLSMQYRRLTTKSERFNFFENLQERSLNLLLEKYYGKELGRLNERQQEAATAFVRSLIDGTTRAKNREIKNLISKSYTVTNGDTANLEAHRYIEDLVNDLANERAVERGAPKATQQDIDAVKTALAEQPLTETQVPGAHFGIDVGFFDQVMSENPQLIRHMLNAIIEGDWDASKVRFHMNNAERSAYDGGSGMSLPVDSGKREMLRTAEDVATEAMDRFYTYVWKPATLLSLKYTTRNVFEGYLRTFASMVDMHSHLGYGWTDMLKARRDAGATLRYIPNKKYRAASKKAQKELDAKLDELRREEGLLSRQIAKPLNDGQLIIRKTHDKMISQSDKEVFKNSDGMTLSVEFLKEQIKYAQRFKTPGIPEADAALKTIKSVLKPSIFGKKKYGSQAGSDFIEAIVKGEYSDAAAIARSSNVQDIVTAVTKYRDDADFALSKLKAETAGGAGTVENILENSKFALQRLILHADKTVDLLISRGALRDDVFALSAKTTPGGKIRTSFSGIKQVEISDGVFIDQALAGEAGDMLRMETSSKSSSTRLLADDLRTTGSGIMTNGFSRRPVYPYDKYWAQAHSDYVNNVLMRDAATRHMIELLASGKSRGEAIKETKLWVKSSDPEAINWAKETKQNMSSMSKAMGTDFNLDKELETLYVQVEQYLPYQYKMYEDAVKGMTPVRSAEININDREMVMAARPQHDKSLSNMYRNAVALIFNYIGTLPEDQLIRHPFFSMVHDNEARRLAARYEKYAKKNGMNAEQTRQLIEDNAARIKAGATSRAYKELMQRLYSVERYTTPAKFLRWVTPFYMAHQNSSRFWLGTSLRNPEVAYALAKAYTAPYRAGMVYDEEGNRVDSGTPWTTSTGKESIVLNSGWLRGVTGRDTLTINPTSIDVITQGQLPVLPTLGGPVGEIVAREGLKFALKYTGTDKYLRNNFGVSLDEFSAKYILPYYEKTGGSSVFSQVGTSFMPLNSASISLLSSVYGYTGKLPIIENVVPQVTDRWNSKYQAAMLQVVTEMNLNGESLNSDVVKSRSTDIARKALLVEGISSAVGPVVAFKTDDAKVRELRSRLTKYQNDPNVGYANASVKLAMELDQEGIQFSSAVVSSLRAASADNRFGLLSNADTANNVRSNIKAFSQAAQLYKDNPFLGELFNIPGEGNNYSPIADDLLYSIKVNGEPLKSRNLSPEDSMRNNQITAGWSSYFSALEYLKKDMANKGFIENTPQYDAYFGQVKDNLTNIIGEQFPAWATKDNLITLQQSDKFIELATYFINDKQFMSTAGKKNPAIKGLKLYLEGRDWLVAKLEQNRAMTGTQGLDTNANRNFMHIRDLFAEEIIKEVPEFEQMWTRYLSKDELNVVSSPLLQGSN